MLYKELIEESVTIISQYARFVIQVERAPLCTHFLLSASVYGILRTGMDGICCRDRSQQIPSM